MNIADCMTYVQCIEYGIYAPMNSPQSLAITPAYDTYGFATEQLSGINMRAAVYRKRREVPMNLFSKSAAVEKTTGDNLTVLKNLRVSLPESLK